MNQRICAAIVLCGLAGVAAAAPGPYRTIPVEPLESEAAPLKAGEVAVSFGGFVKLDVL